MTKILRRRVRGYLVAVSMLAVVTGFSVSPAYGHSTPAAVEARSVDCSAFSPLAQLTSGAGVDAARGGDAREPASTEAAVEIPASAKGKGGPGFKATVPVWFHVLHDGVEGNLSFEQVTAQVNVLNTTFGGGEGGYDSGFRFKLAGVTRTDNAEWFRHGYGDKAERDMKKALHRGGWETLNLYSTQASAYLGWAYFPGLPESRQYLDGIVVDWESMPGTSTRYAGRYDQGETATHEAGHWLNLYHVFQGGCNNWGDYVADTPPQLIATNGCPVGQDSCSEPGIDSIHNYMDYSYDTCYYEFSAGQAARMQDAWLYFRAKG